MSVPKTDSNPTHSEDYSVSIVIPTFNRPQNLLTLLNSVLNQTEVPAEIIVVDDSDNNLSEIIVNQISKLMKSKIRLMYQHGPKERKGICRARNQGMALANSGIVSFIDDDVILDRRYIEKILEIFKRNPMAIGVQGYAVNLNFSPWGNVLGKVFFLYFSEEGRSRILPSAGLTFPWPLKKEIECDWMSGTNSNYRRTVLKEFRWDECLGEYSLYDDADLSYRILKRYPHSLFVTPHAKFSHVHSNTARRDVRLDTYTWVSFSTYFFFKNIKQTLRNRVIFVWSMFGRFLFLPLWRKNSVQTLHSIGAFIYLLRNFKEVVQGNFSFLKQRESRS